MTYEEYFRHLQELNKMHRHEAATEQEIDEEIALVSQLPCTGGGVPNPFFGGQQESGVVLDVRALDRGEKFPGHHCPHCSWLATYKWAKSAHEARRNGMPEPPPPWLVSVTKEQLDALSPKDREIVEALLAGSSNPPALPES